MLLLLIPERLGDFYFFYYGIFAKAQTKKLGKIAVYAGVVIGNIV